MSYYRMKHFVFLIYLQKAIPERKFRTFRYSNVKYTYTTLSIYGSMVLRRRRTDQQEINFLEKPMAPRYSASYLKVASFLRKEIHGRHNNTYRFEWETWAVCWRKNRRKKAFPFALSSNQSLKRPPFHHEINLYVVPVYISSSGLEISLWVIELTYLIPRYALKE